jgi:hypothetical protein
VVKLANKYSPYPGDTIPAVLEDGEYVLNRNAVKAIGKDRLDRINHVEEPRFAQNGGYMENAGFPTQNKFKLGLARKMAHGGIATHDAQKKRNSINDKEYSDFIQSMNAPLEYQPELPGQYPANRFDNNYLDSLYNATFDSSEAAYLANNPEIAPIEMVENPLKDVNNSELRQNIQDMESEYGIYGANAPIPRATWRSNYYQGIGPTEEGMEDSYLKKLGVYDDEYTPESLVQNVSVSPEPSEEKSSNRIPPWASKDLMRLGVYDDEYTPSMDMRNATSINDIKRQDIELSGERKNYPSPLKSDRRYELLKAGKDLVKDADRTAGDVVRKVGKDVKKAKAKTSSFMKRFGKKFREGNKSNTNSKTVKTSKGNTSSTKKSEEIKKKVTKKKDEVQGPPRPPKFVSISDRAKKGFYQAVTRSKLDKLKYKGGEESNVYVPQFQEGGKVERMIDRKGPMEIGLSPSIDAQMKQRLRQIRLQTNQKKLLKHRSGGDIGLYNRHVKTREESGDFLTKEEIAQTLDYFSKRKYNTFQEGGMVNSVGGAMSGVGMDSRRLLNMAKRRKNVRS